VFVLQLYHQLKPDHDEYHSLSYWVKCLAQEKKSFSRASSAFVKLSWLNLAIPILFVHHIKDLTVSFTILKFIGAIILKGLFFERCYLKIIFTV
jgi:hypothetical protein